MICKWFLCQQKSLLLCGISVHHLRLRQHENPKLRYGNETHLNRSSVVVDNGVGDGDSVSGRDSNGVICVHCAKTRIRVQYSFHRQFFSPDRHSSTDSGNKARSQKCDTRTKQYNSPIHMKVLATYCYKKQRK